MNLLDMGSLVVGVTCCATGGYIIVRKWRRGRDVDSAGAPPSEPTPGASVVASSRSSTPRPGNHLPILDAGQLFHRTGTWGTVEKIRTRLGFTPENFERDVLVLLRNVAEFVQLLPGSESHHHAQPGGLLIHLLDVAAHALSLREGYKLPQGGSPEDQIRLGPVWSYGVLVGALLHDIGKPVADVVVQLYGADPSRSLAQWSGLAGSMVDASSSAAPNRTVTHYTVDFPASEARDYAAHQKLPIALLHALVPRSSMQWLSTDPALMAELVGCLESSDKQPGVLAELITKADSASVAANLRNGSRVRFASARQPPLIERLMKGLRTLAAEGLVAMNRPGAGAFVDPDGEHIWMVAGVVANETRKVLEQREEKSTGAAGLPSDNTRFFDTWAEYGVLVQPPSEFGRGSVWWIRLVQDEWDQVLSCLKFPLAKLYAPGQDRPQPFSGTVTPVDPKSATKSAAVDGALNPAGQAQLDATGAEDSVGTALDQPFSNALLSAEGTSPPAAMDVDDPFGLGLGQSSDVPMAGPVSGDDSAQDGKRVSSPSSTFSRLKPDDAPGLVPGSDGGLLDPFSAPLSSAPSRSQASVDSAAAPAMREPSQSATVAAADDDGFLDEAQSVQAAASLATRPARAVQAMPVGPKPAFKTAPGAKPRPNADRFMAWLQQGLGSGELGYNESDAVVHFVADGMLLVSPRAFKVYLETNPFLGEVGNSKDALRALQLEVQKSGYVGGNPRDKGNFHYWRVRQADGTESSSVITTYLIPNPQSFIRPVPAPNELLQRTERPIKPDRSDRRTL